MILQQIQDKISIITHELVHNTRHVFFHTWIALALTAAISYGAGFMRDRLIAQSFGAGFDLDIFYAAFSVPDLIFAIIVTSTVGAAFIPMFTKVNYTSSEKKVVKKINGEVGGYTYSTLIVLMILIVTAALVAMIAAPWIAQILTPSGYTDEQQEKYAHLMQIMLLSPILFAISTVFGGVLLATKDFFFYGIAPVFYNLGIIIGLYVLSPTFGVYGLALGTIFGAALHMLSRVVIGVARIGFSACFAHVKIWKDPLIKKTVLLTLPKIPHILAWQILLLWFIRLAGEIQEGGPTIYNYARNFQSMPVSLIGISIALSAFSALSTSYAQKNKEDFYKTLRKSLPVVFGLTSLAAIALYTIAPILISTILEGGQFTTAAAAQTAFLIQIYALSIPFESLSHLLSRGCYALHRTFMPSLINVTMIIIIIGLSWILHAQHDMGLKAIPISFAIGLVIQNLALSTLLQRYIKKSFT